VVDRNAQVRPKEASPLDMASFAVAANPAAPRMADYSSSRSKRPAKRHRCSGYTSMSPQHHSHHHRDPQNIRALVCLRDLRDRTRKNVGTPPMRAERLPKTTLRPVLQRVPGFDERQMVGMRVGILPGECVYGM
jgi:hypothetical protein